MPRQTSFWLGVSQVAAQHATMVLLVVLAFCSLLWTATAMAGLLPWLSILAAGADQTVYDIGVGVQIAMTLVLASLWFFLPSHLRVLKLEVSHRKFQLNMDDVARAYEAVLAKDREGAFRLPGEFDAVRERLQYMHSRFDLSRLEPELLELAAQMSYHSRDLAQTYSEEAVSRAQSFLTARKAEAERLRFDIAEARKTALALRHASDLVEIAEGSVKEEIEALRSELRDLLPRLGVEALSPAEPFPSTLPREAPSWLGDSGTFPRLVQGQAGV
jgi:hypothetical protein